MDTLDKKGGQIKQNAQFYINILLVMVNVGSILTDTNA